MKHFFLLKQVLLVLCFFTALNAQAQTGTISGKVLDETGQPLPGASVAVKGTTKIVATTADGSFSFPNISGKVTLVANFIGYQTLEQNVAVSGNTTVTLNLNPDKQQLNEVVVIGYGAVQRKDLTGSVTAISSKDFQKGTITTPDQLIQGKVPGVSIISNGGQPGGSAQIRIRGGASLNASNDPLIVIDGVPFSGNSIGNAPSPLSLINPNDIETFTVLKDANATAIYGSRASNGVILITTKKGTTGKPTINFSTNNSVATLARKIDVLSANEIRDYVNANGTSSQIALLGTANTDWQDEIYREAFTTDNNISVSGTAKSINMPYRISGGYLNQNGLLLTDQLKRGTAGLNLSPKFFDNHLKVDLNLKAATTKSVYANQGAIGAAIQFDPTQAVYDQNSIFGGYFEWQTGSGTSALPNPNTPRNPVALIRQKSDIGEAKRSFGNLTLDYAFHFLPELRANLNLGYDISQGTGYTFIPDYAAQSYATRGSYQERKNKENSYTSEFYLNYAKTLQSINSRIDATAGYGYYDIKQTNFNYTSYRGDRETVITEPAYPFEDQQNKLLSYYGRLIYTLANKYILSATMRADASSKFAEENRWGYFPSVGLTWRIINEDFLQNSKVFSDLKLRLSYGETGNKDGIANYDYLARYYPNTNAGQYQIGNTFYNYYSPAGYDRNLKWETTTTYNAGLDFGFLKGKIFGSVDVYTKKTRDLLSTVNIPLGVNFTNLLTTNVGNMEVKGIEGNINLNLIENKDMNWTVGFNASYNDRKITNLTLVDDNAAAVGAGGISGATGIELKYNAVNQSPGAFLVRKQVYDADGKPIYNLYADVNGDGKSDATDKYYYHTPDPKVTMGFSTSFNYKKWTLSTVLRASLGNYIYDNVSSNFGVNYNLLSVHGNINNVARDFLYTGFSGLNGYQYLSDYYIKNASFVKMDNLGLTYDVGRFLKNSSANLRISANVQNVFTISKYDGIDPESVTGIDNNLYPRPRTYTLGLNLGF
jgi:iron complex outermembrane receptor protein